MIWVLKTLGQHAKLIKHVFLESSFIHEQLPFQNCYNNWHRQSRFLSSRYITIETIVQNRQRVVLIDCQFCFRKFEAKNGFSLFNGQRHYMISLSIKKWKPIFCFKLSKTNWESIKTTLCLLWTIFSMVMYLDDRKIDCSCQLL